VTEPAWRKWIRHPAVICGLLAIVTLSAFARVGSFEFVNYDDPDYVTSNSHVKAGLTWAEVGWAFTTGHASNWHPLTWLSHIFDWTLFGEDPAGHHLTSVGFHMVNTVLVFLVFRKMTGALWRSAMLAALFGLHPMHVESVAWVSERKDVLSGLFFLLALGAYARYVEVVGEYSVFSLQYSEAVGEQPSKRGEAWRWYLATVVAFALGLMSKPMLVTVPFVLLLLDYWPLARSAECGVPSAGSKKLGTLSKGICWGRLALEKVPFVVLSLGSCIVTFIVQRKGGAVSTSLGLAGRIANAVVSYARYVGKLLFPVNLSVLYPHPGHWGADAIIGSSLFLLALFTVVFLLGRRRRYLPVGWLWFIGMLVPAIGLVQVGIQSMADRYSYLPSIGFFLALVWGIAEFADRNIRASARVGILTPASALALLVCALITFRQAAFWRNSESLFRRAAQVTRNNYLAYNNLGFYLSGKGKIREAMENYEKALQIDPNYEDALNNMGFALAGLKRHQDAIPYYEKALRIKPKHAEVHNNLGNALAETGKIEEAITHYKIVLEQVPDHADAHNNLGIALAMQGKLDEAMTHFRLAIHFKPTDPGAHSNLGNGLAAQHKLDEAIKEYEESLRLRPEDSQAENNLGNVLAEQGKLDKAIAHYQKSVSLGPDNPETRFNLGIVLIRRGNPEGATTNFSEALRLKPDYAAALNELNRLRAQPR
jgi:tetratricopeptide (TPR) repeat protein